MDAKTLLSADHRWVNNGISLLIPADSDPRKLFLRLKSWHSGALMTVRSFKGQSNKARRGQIDISIVSSDIVSVKGFLQQVDVDEDDNLSAFPCFDAECRRLVEDWDDAVSGGTFSLCLEPDSSRTNQEFRLRELNYRSISSSIRNHRSNEPILRMLLGASFVIAGSPDPLPQLKTTQDEQQAVVRKLVSDEKVLFQQAPAGTGKTSIKAHIWRHSGLRNIRLLGFTCGSITSSIPILGPALVDEELLSYCNATRSHCVLFVIPLLHVSCA